MASTVSVMSFQRSSAASEERIGVKKRESASAVSSAAVESLDTASVSSGFSDASEAECMGAPSVSSEDSPVPFSSLKRSSAAPSPTTGSVASKKNGSLEGSDAVGSPASEQSESMSSMEPSLSSSAPLSQISLAPLRSSPAVELSVVSVEQSESMSSMEPSLSSSAPLSQISLAPLRSSPAVELSVVSVEQSESMSSM